MQPTAARELIRYARAIAAVATAVSLGDACAQFDAAKVQPDPDNVARQFADPDVRFDTPGFAAGRSDFPSHAEVFAYLANLAAASPHVRIETIGHSQEGRAMALVVLTGTDGHGPKRPTVMILGQQHGNEPAGGEAALVLAHELAIKRPELLERVNVLIVPRANPDGAEHFVRTTANGADVNRDHLLVHTPEAQAMAGAMRRYPLDVVLDLHEFTVGGRWITKFGARMRYDALIQGATTANLDPRVAEAQARYVAAARSALEGAGLRVADYHTTAAAAQDKTVYMGGINVDTGRNVGGLRNAVSILLETRGVGLGREHFARRVDTHVIAAMAVIEKAAAEGPRLVAMRREAGARMAAAACRGELVVASRQTPMRRTLSFLDAQTGEPREIEVDWRSSAELETLRQRSRPCGYLLAPSEAHTVALLRELGIEVDRITDPKAGFSVERYVVDNAGAGQRQDGRGAIDDGEGEGIRILDVHTETARIVSPKGSFFVPMQQPFAGLVSAALEPDSQNSYAANRILDIDANRLQRVMEMPAKGVTAALP